MMTIIPGYAFCRFKKGMRMKKIAQFIVLLSVWGMNGAVGQEHRESNVDLLGKISKEDLQQAPYAEWFDEGVKNYQVDRDALSGVEDLLDGIDVKIVLGTWCHDSKREVPHIYKILEGANLAADKITMIALDRKKQAPDGEIDGMGITNTPTFIFYRGGNELNRIVEKPVESLEKDIVRILKGEEYRHSKLP